MPGAWGVDPLNVNVTNAGEIGGSGQVEVTNFPATQPVSGTVTVQDGGSSITVDGSISSMPLVAETLTAKGTATMNATSDAGRQIVALGSNPPAGYYQVDVYSRFDGGTVTGATDSGNFEVRVGGTSKFRCVALPSSSTSTAYQLTTGFVSCNGSQSLTVNAVGNASNTGSVYNCLINVTRVA